MAKEAIVNRDVRPGFLTRMRDALRLRKARKIAGLLAMRGLEVHIRNLKVGANTIIMNPSGGPGDVLEWSAAQAPDAIRQLGMSTGGRPMGYVGAAPVDSIMSGDAHSLLGTLGADDHTLYTLADGARAFSGDQAMGGNKLTGLGAPVASDDAARLQDVLGLATQDPVNVAADSALPAYTAAGAGVGKTITADAAGILSIDGINTTLGDRVLVTGEGATHVDHGIYEVTVEGTVGVAFELTRATDYDGSTGNEITSGDIIIITEGTVYDNTLWMLATDENIVVDTTAFVFAQVGVQVSDHGALTGLSDDDHSIYALIAGRSGGQTIKGGIDASDDLILQSTNHATKGNVLPSADDTETFGASATRWKNGFFAIMTVGDQRFANKWGWTEDYENDGMVMFDSNQVAVMAVYGDGIYHREYNWRRTKGWFGKRRVPVYNPAKVDNN